MQEIFNKYLEDLKNKLSTVNNKITEIKNALEGTNSRVTDPEQMNELGDRIMELTEAEYNKLEHTHTHTHTHQEQSQTPLG